MNVYFTRDDNSCRKRDLSFQMHWFYFVLVTVSCSVKLRTWMSHEKMAVKYKT